MAMKFRAHDTFFIRKGWLSKGMKYVHNRADVFVSRDENPTDVLGIGTNMVKALRYWLQAVGVTQEPVTGRRVQTFTELGNQIYEHDRYIEELGTLQLLHYKLASNKEEATAWYYFFNEFKMTEFTKEDFVSALQSYVLMSGEDISVALRSLNDDFTCIVNTYLPRYKSNPGKISPENNIDCPFGELGFIDILSKEKRTYKKSIPAAKSFSPWVILAVIVDQVAGREEIALNELLTAPCNIGRVFNLDAITMLDILHRVEKTGEIKIIRTAGLDIVRLNNQRTFQECVDRVEGIKKVVNESDKYNDEQIPVIFIGHKTDNAGMQRSRRLFSTLNRYAKPVSMRDIIALDEDDVVAIASRDLIDTHPLFARDRLLDSRTKAIPENNGKAFTTIITFYECNLEILWILLKDMDVLNSEGTKTKGKGKIKEFIRKRPNDETIHQFEELCGAFWNALIERFEDIYTYAAAEPNAQPYRNRAGGNLLFRPVALLPFVRAAVKVSIQQKKDFDEIFGDFPQELLYIDNIIWRNTLWNSDKGTMIVNNQKLTERILLYYWDRSTLTAKEISTMKLEIKSNLQLADMEDVETLLADAIDK